MAMIRSEIVSGQVSNEIELQGGSAEANESMFVPGATGVASKNVSNASAKDNTGKLESLLSVRTITVAAVCVILSALTSIIVAVVYHMSVANAENSDDIASQMQELRGQLDMLLGKQSNSTSQLDRLELDQERASRHLETLVQTKTDIVRKLDVLEQTQINRTQQIDTLEQIQANASIHIEALMERQTTTNHQLDIFAEQQQNLTNTGQQVAFSVYNLKSTTTNRFAVTFYNTAVNTGSYNMTSGVFTSPLSGLYYLSFSFERNSEPSGIVNCHFYVNGYADNIFVRARTGNYEVASGSVILHLSVNGTVKLTCSPLKYVETGAKNAVFSGFLINPD